MLCTLGNVDSYHSAARQCLHCCKIYQANPMGIAKFRGGSQNSQTPEPIVKKFGVGDYVGDDSPHAKMQNFCPIGAWRRMREISPSRGF